jgi:hypothetical protein
MKDGFSVERLVFGHGPQLTDDELELMSIESENSKSVSLFAFEKRMRKKLARISKSEIGKQIKKPRRK